MKDITNVEKNNKDTTISKKQRVTQKRSSLITKIFIVLICIIAIMLVIKFIPKKNENIEQENASNAEENIDYSKYLDKDIEKGKRLNLVQEEIKKRQENVTKLNEELNEIQVKLQEYDGKVYAISSKDMENNEVKDEDKIKEFKDKKAKKNIELQKELDIISKLYEVYNSVMEEKY